MPQKANIERLISKPGQMRPSARDSNSSRRENSEKKSTAALQMVLADQRLWKHIQKNSRLKSETTGQLAQNSSARKTQNDGGNRS